MAYCDFKVGDEVVCIRSCPVAPVFTHEGECYLVERVELVAGEPSLFFVGVPDGSPHRTFWIGRQEQAFYGYNPSRFRKVQRRDLNAWLATENTIEGPVRGRKRVRA